METWMRMIDDDSFMPMMRLPEMISNFEESISLDDFTWAEKTFLALDGVESLLQLDCANESQV